jgi:hypothetical protein
LGHARSSFIIPNNLIVVVAPLEVFFFVLLLSIMTRGRRVEGHVAALVRTYLDASCQ